MRSAIIVLWPFGRKPPSPALDYEPVAGEEFDGLAVFPTAMRSVQLAGNGGAGEAVAYGCQQVSSRRSSS